MTRVDKYKANDTICKNCLSQINYKNPNPARADLFDTIIIDNKNKIMEIRSNKINLLGGDTAEVLSCMRENVLPLADELLFLSETFETEICNKMSGNTARADEIAKIKSFINSIELTPNGDPNVFGIGANIPLKHKYIKLALFLINFGGISNDNNDHKGMCENLKGHMLRMVQLRKAIIMRITLWLRYLTGPFYDYVHNLEGLPVDENFRKNLQIDYVSEEDLLKLKAFYEAELQKRDARIAQLEGELQKRDVRIQQLEDENARLKQQVNVLGSENQKLVNLNQEYAKQIEGFKREISELKIDFERRLRTTLENMKNEYEAKMNDLIGQINQMKSSFADLEIRYNSEKKQWMLERDQLINQLKNLNVKYENDMRAANERYELLVKEVNSLKAAINNHIIQINQLNLEKENMSKTIESLRNAIANLENEKKALIQQLNVVTKERDDLRIQLNSVTQERDSLRVNIEGLRNQINNLEVQLKNTINQLNVVVKERDELRSQLTIVTQERDGLRHNLEAARTQISNLETQLKNTVNQLNALIKERDELRSQLTIVIQERDGLRQNLEAARNQINNLDNQVKTLNNNLNNVTREREDLHNQLLNLKSELEKAKNEISLLISIKNNFESRFGDLQKKFEELSGAYTKLQSEYNLKITIINGLENKIKQLGGVVSNSEGQFGLFAQTIKKLEEELKNARRENEELRARLLIITERENEISRLKISLNSVREEWNKLFEAYEALLADLRAQIAVNESFRMVIFDLQSKIESHNVNVGGLDNNLRQQIEALMRQALTKKSIDINDNSEMLRRAQTDIENLRNKISRFDKNAFSIASIYSNLNMNQTTSVEVKKTVVVSNSTSNGDYSNNNYRYFNNGTGNTNGYNGVKSTIVNSNNPTASLYQSYEQRYASPNVYYKSYEKVASTTNANDQTNPLDTSALNVDNKNEEIVLQNYGKLA